MQPLAHYIELFRAGTLVKSVACPVLIWNDPPEATAEETPTFTREMDTYGKPKRTRSAVVFELTGAVAGGPALTLGRGAACSVHLHEESVSRAHAELASTPHGWTAVDLGSRNGTWVGKARMPPGAPTRVSDGDRLQLGNVELFFMMPESFQSYLSQMTRRETQSP
jgi:pSer/pThr/pTyr-binding forkhead associated (FHA) protein